MNPSTGLEDTWLGHMGTILLTSGAWSVLHIQYDLYQIVSIFVLGLLIGWVRAASGSLLPCYLMHGFVNLVASVETFLAASVGT